MWHPYEFVLTSEVRGENDRRIGKPPAGMALRGGYDRGLRTAQERVGRELFPDGRGQRRFAATALFALARLARLEPRIVRFDRLGETDVGERVFVPAEDPRGLGPARELAERRHHLPRRS